MSAVRITLAALCGTALLASCAAPAATTTSSTSTTTSSTTTSTTSSAPAAGDSASSSSSSTTTSSTTQASSPASSAASSSAPSTAAASSSAPAAGTKKFATAKLPKSAAGYTTDEVKSITGNNQMANYEKAGTDGLQFNMVTLQESASPDSLKKMLKNTKDYGPITCGEMDTDLGTKKTTAKAGGPKATMCVGQLDTGVLTLAGTITQDEAGKLLKAIYDSFA